MKQDSFHILPPGGTEQEENIRLSFRRFIGFIEERRHREQTMKTKLYDYVLRFFETNPAAALPMDDPDLARFPNLLDLLYACLFPPLSDEQDLVWALSLPNSDHVFYSTTAFHRMLSPDSPNGLPAMATPGEKEAFTDSLEQLKYALILERFYHIKPLVQEEFVYEWTDKRTGLPRYYSIHIDNRFVEVFRKAGAPQADVQQVKHYLKKIDNLCQIEGALPLSEYLFEGFSIVTASDITARWALHKMRSAIIRHVPENFDDTYRTIIALLKAMFGRQQVDFGLLPFLKVNNRLVAYYADYSHSISINIARQQHLPEEAFVSWINQYFLDPQVVFYDSGSEPLRDDLFQQAFSRQGVKAYALLPVYHNNDLAGLLEVSTFQEDVLDVKLMALLEPALPILSQLMHNNQAEFGSSIDNVIKVNFTAVQPAVQWKFNEVAWRYLKTRYEQGAPVLPAPIRFEQVYPLYGAIDIRNSTIERNHALNRDFQTCLGLLEETLQSIEPLGQKGMPPELAEESIRIQQELGLYGQGNDEVNMHHLMDRMDRYLEALQLVGPEYDGVVNKYFAAVHPLTGIVFEQRRLLEQSMQTINNSISQYLESMQSEFQRLYPLYFEKFRTDGIEYDLYVGQSINPAIPFRQEHVQELQTWQLRSMAALASLVHTQLPYMPVKLQTTQLIYVNSGTIDISFRPDEKRFDAEGGYNIRYHIVKKRIDKVHVSSTGERLTQPGRIAIVYAQPGQYNDYKRYIAALQQEGVLENDLEELVLEDLQGVSGLKALRVGVVL